jgi:hypothetical protein
MSTRIVTCTLINADPWKCTHDHRGHTVVIERAVGPIYGGGGYAVKLDGIWLKDFYHSHAAALAHVCRRICGGET